MKLNREEFGDDSIVKEDIQNIESQPEAKRPRRSSVPETSTEKAEITKDAAASDDDEAEEGSGEGRQSLADRIIERIRRALSPRSDGRATDHEADDESESDIEQVDGKEIDVADKDKSITDKEKKDKDKKRTKRMKKTKDKDKKLKAKKKKKPKTASKDKDDVSDKIEYAKEYPDDKPDATTEGETTDHELKLPHAKKEAVEKALASAGIEPPPLPDISPPKSPEHQVQVTVEGEKPTVETSGKVDFSSNIWHWRI